MNKLIKEFLTNKKAREFSILTMFAAAMGDAGLPWWYAK